MDKIDKDFHNRIAVCSRSFSKNPILRKELCQKYHHVKFNDMGESLSGDGLVKFLSGFNKAITALETLDRETLEALPQLETIGKFGVGLDMIDQHAMSELGIRLGAFEGVNKRSVAELTLGLMLCMLRKIVQSHNSIASNEWNFKGGRELTGKVVGIIGCGNIGRDLVELLSPFRCKILVCDVKAYPWFKTQSNLEQVSLERALAEAEILTIHTPLSSETKNLISRKELSKLRADCLLINAARGGIVNEDDLYDALVSNSLSGAAIDVFEEEPVRNNKLFQLGNFIGTPHIGGSTEEGILAMGRAAIKGLEQNEIPVVK